MSTPHHMWNMKSTERIRHRLRCFVVSIWKSGGEIVVVHFIILEKQFLLSSSHKIHNRHHNFNDAHCSLLVEMFSWINRMPCFMWTQYFNAQCIGWLAKKEHSSNMNEWYNDDFSFWTGWKNHYVCSSVTASNYRLCHRLIVIRYDHIWMPMNSVLVLYTYLYFCFSLR